MSYYQAEPMEPVALEIGQQVELDGKPALWTVQGVSEHYAVLTQRGKRGISYTVLDWRCGVRGPCNLVGQGYGDGTYSPEQCAEMLKDFEYVHTTDPAYIEAQKNGKTSWIPARMKLEVSGRNWVRLAPNTIRVVNLTPEELKKARNRDRNRERKAAERAKMTPEERRAKRREADRRYREAHREQRRAADRLRWSGGR